MVYTIHASLRTAVKEWLDGFHSLQNITSALSISLVNLTLLQRRPDYESINTRTSEQVTSVITSSSPVSALRAMMRKAYKHDRELSCLKKYFTAPSAYWKLEFTE